MFDHISFNDSADAAYCEKLAHRFNSMGIAPKASQAAIASLAESDAVPDFISRVASPSMFGFAKPQASSVAFSEQPALQG